MSKETRTMDQDRRIWYDKIFEKRIQNSNPNEGESEEFEMKTRREDQKNWTSS